MQRRDRLGSPFRPHAAAHRPARAVGGVRPAVRHPDRELSPRHRVVHDRPRARGDGRARSRAAEDEANRIVWEDRPVDVRFVIGGGGGQRCRCARSRSATGTLRLIEVEDFDLSACGGTHVARTGAIGIIVVTGRREVPRRRARPVPVRRPRAAPVRRRGAMPSPATQKHLSVAPDELAAAIERLQGENKALQRTLRGAQEKLAVHEAAALVARAAASGRPPRRGRGDCRVWMPLALKAHGCRGCRRTPALRSCCSAPRRRRWSSWRATRPPASTPSAVLKALVARFGGKGGGKPDLAQGGGLIGDPGGARGRRPRDARRRKHEAARRTVTFVLFVTLRVYRGAMRSAPSRRITSPFSISFSMTCRDERRVFGGPAQPRRERHLLSERHARGFGQRGQERRVEDARRDRHARGCRSTRTPAPPAA